MTADREAPTRRVHFKLNGRQIAALDDENILHAAARNGVEIPHLCYSDGMRSDGNCRACMVEIEGERVLAPACIRRPSDNMIVYTNNKRALHSQKLVLELLKSDMEAGLLSQRNEVEHWSHRLGLGNPRFKRRANPPLDVSHPAITVNLGACIHCTRCVRACREEQVNDVIGFAWRGAESAISFDLGDPLGESSCVGCGECVQACPTAALIPADGGRMAEPDQKVDTVCPYCGVGCLLSYHVKDNKIILVEGRGGPSNRGRLCVKGRYGFDYIHHPERLTQPLIRRPEASKRIDVERLNGGDIDQLFRTASWDEALDKAAAGLRAIRDEYRPSALAGFGSAKGSNEEAYLFQKLIRTGFGTNNVDHCTRLCHASSVAALLEMIGSGAVSNQVADVAQTEVIIVIGSNTTENHPVAATFMKNAVQAGKTLIVMDPRRTPLAAYARHFLQFKPDTDVALLNAIMQAVIDEGLVHKTFVATRTRGYETLEAHLATFSPEAVAPLCGIEAETIREVARVYASSKAAMIFWGMGISQHVHGTDNARALISLALMCGQIGRPGTGLHPLRGQNNVQGASDVGLIPMVFPDYQRVDDAQARAKFETLWGTKLDPKPGLTVVEIMEAVTAGRLRGMYIMGENPAMSDPNLSHTRQALAGLGHLVVQDLFVTETALFADVVLPASAAAEKSGTFTNTDRRVQLGRRALDPPGEAREDLWIIQEIARRMGLRWEYAGPQQVFEEMRRAMPSIAGVTWERLEREDSVTYPCRSEDAPGEPVLFTEGFPMPDGLARFVPSPFTTADELPDREYPFALITGRLLEHWHTGAMTRRSHVLDMLEPEPMVIMCSEDLHRLQLSSGDKVRVSSRRGEIVAAARADDGVQAGQIFLPFCYREAAANLLTNEAVDPIAKIPEFKFCAVRLRTVASRRGSGLAGARRPPRDMRIKNDS